NAAGNYSGSSDRGSYNITPEANRYFIFPQFYNFRYNVFSPDWSIANRLIELYMQNNWEGPDRERQTNGISSSEKANILLEQKTFKDLLADAEHRKLMNNIVGLKASQLFAPAELNMGVRAFRDSLYSVLNGYTFRNVQLESILDTLGKMSETDILASMKSWNDPVKLPVYSVGTTELINVNDRGQEFFVLKVPISNNSDYDGIIQMNLNIARGREYDPRADRKIMIPAHRSMQLVSVWDNTPNNITLNTLISGNLPNIIRQPVNTAIKRENRRLREQEEDIIMPEDFVENVLEEVIVDNEDSTLFSLSKKQVIGLLPKLLDNADDTKFKYSGFSWWWAPRQWTATTNTGYYGKYIRSAYVVKSVRSRGGSQTATWKIPVPSPGHYELYYYVSKDDYIKNNRNTYNDAEYRFKVAYGEDIEDAYIRIIRANEGWEQMGVYYFASDTVKVTLSNECKLNYVTADAVKIVKRQE
ncbi:MAG: xanthan lyase, partial [Prevotellaceae bacterium]|nr:xanthan lyase [Prevotellaceae bacterium]